MVISKNNLRLLFIYKSQLLLFWLYIIMQSINNQFLVFQNDQTCYIIVSYLEEKQKPFLVQSIEKEKKINLSNQMYFLALVQSQVPTTWNLKYLKTGLFLSLLSVIFGFLNPKNLPIPNFKMKSWLEQVLTDYINSKWQILPQNTHFGKIFKSQ